MIFLFISYNYKKTPAVNSRSSQLFSTFSYLIKKLYPRLIAPTFQFAVYQP